MSKWISYHITTVVFFGLILSVIFLTPTLSLSAQATLAWDHTAPAADGYRIFQRTGGQAYNYGQPCWTGTTNKSTIGNLKDDTTYYFVVRAYMSSQESTNSNEVEFVYRTPSSAAPIDSDGDGASDNADADGTTNTDNSNGTDPSTDNVATAGSGASNIVIDDGQSGTSSSGQWLKSGAVNFYGSKSLYSKGAGATYNYQSSIAGAYDVEMWWTEYASRCTNVPVRIYDGATLLETVVLNQKQDGGQWNYLGIYEFTGTAKVVVVSKGSACSTSADAVKLSKADSVGGADKKTAVIDDGQTGTASSGQWLKSGGVNPYGSKSLYSKGTGATYSYQSPLSGTQDVELWWTAYASRCASVPVKIYDGATLLKTIVVSQKQNGGQWNLLGSYDFSGKAKVVIVSKDSSCSTCADAIRFAGN